MADIAFENGRAPGAGEFHIHRQHFGREDIRPFSRVRGCRGDGNASPTMRADANAAALMLADGEAVSAEDAEKMNFSHRSSGRGA